MNLLSPQERYELLTRISKATDLDVLLDIFGAEIEKQSLAECYIISLCDESANNLTSLKIRFPDEFRYLEKTYLGYKNPLVDSEQNTSVRAFHGRNAVFFDEDSAPDSEKHILKRWKITSCAAFPLADAADQLSSPIGTILLMRQEGDIPARAYAILAELTDIFFVPMRVALGNSFLKDFHDRFKQSVESDEHARVLKFIIEINNLTSQDKIFELFAEELFKQMAFDCIAVFMAEGDELHKKMVACSSERYADVRDEWSGFLTKNNYVLNNIDGGVSHAFLKNSSLMIADVQEILQVPMSEKDRHTLRILKTPRTLLVLPIRYHDKPIGCITFFSLAQAIEISNPDLQLLDTLSSFLGTAITNCRYFALSKEQNAELERLATHDILTGLPNRALMRDRLQQGLARWERRKQKATIAFLDLDHFKSINDSLGHSVGDKVLVTIANKLKNCLRLSDTISRIGGDEFVLLLEEPGDIADHQRLLQRVLDIVCEPMADLEQEITMTCSIGFSRYPEDGLNSDMLLDAADAAMYLAKQLGRSNIQAFTPDMRTHANERLTMESSLRHAVERDQLLLHYQPKADLVSGRIVGVEALVRWQHPELGLVSPGVFIPIAEESGLIVPIGEWILRTACAQAAVWQHAGMRISVAVNLSARQFQQTDIASRVEDALQACGLDPQLLELELTESMSMDNPDKSIAVLKTFKQLGITLTIDDFGTGYSNLSYLKRFPVDKLKLDQSFVRDIVQSSEAMAISQAVLAVAHSLHLKVVAEGVETLAQLRLLTENGCDEMQGFYFSKPLPVAECTRFLQEDRRLYAI